METKSHESRRTLTLPAVVLRTLERHKVNQAERRIAGARSAAVRLRLHHAHRRPMQPTLVTRDLKRVLAQTWWVAVRIATRAAPRSRVPRVLRCSSPAAELSWPPPFMREPAGRRGADSRHRTREYRIRNQQVIGSSPIAGSRKPRVHSGPIVAVHYQITTPVIWCSRRPRRL